jgi:predicted solute-binding protein
LWCQFVPQLKWKLTVRGGQGGDKSILELLDYLLCRVDAVVMRLYKLQSAILLGEKLFNVFCGLVIHDIQFRFESLTCEVVEVHFVRIEDADVI